MMGENSKMNNVSWQELILMNRMALEQRQYHII